MYLTQELKSRFVVSFTVQISIDFLLSPTNTPDTDSLERHLPIQKPCQRTSPFFTCLSIYLICVSEIYHGLSKFQQISEVTELDNEKASMRNSVSFPSRY